MSQHLDRRAVRLAARARRTLHREPCSTFTSVTASGLAAPRRRELHQPRGNWLTTRRIRIKTPIARMSILLFFKTETVTVSAMQAEPSWWRGHTPLALAAIVLIVFASTFPFFAGFLLETPGLHFTGNLTYPEDIAQHEAWASEMAAHLRYQNLLTPEPTGRGWFFSPLELCFGVIQRATGIPYMVLRTGLVLLCAQHWPSAS